MTNSDSSSPDQSSSSSDSPSASNNGPSIDFTKPADDPTSGQAPGGRFDQDQATTHVNYGAPQQNYTPPQPEVSPYGGQPTPEQPYGQPYGGQQYAQPAPQYGQPNQPYAQPSPYGGYAPVDPTAPFGRDPYTGEPLSDKSKMAAGLLQIFLGTFGVGRFYLGDNKTGGIMLGLTILGWVTSIIFVGLFIAAGVWLWALIDGIMILNGSVRDPQGRKLSS